MHTKSLFKVTAKHKITGAELFDFFASNDFAEVIDMARDFYTQTQNWKAADCHITKLEDRGIVHHD